MSGGPEPESGRAGLATVMEHLAAQDLDPTRPLWRVYIVHQRPATHEKPARDGRQEKWHVRQQFVADAQELCRRVGVISSTT